MLSQERVSIFYRDNPYPYAEVLHLARTGDRYLTVNWYYRPSQTSHPEDRTFYEQEVFKSNLFIDHKLEDLLERISVMHISDYTKGRFDYWDEDMPLYVVEHRWNVETNSFSKIKNWSLCIPEDSAPDPLSFRPFLDNAPPPNRIKSPFFRDSGITGPGQPGDSLVYEADEQLAYYTPLKNWPEGTGGLTGYAKKMLSKRLADPIVPSQHADTREQDGLPAQKRGKQARTESPTIVEISGDAALTKENFAPTTDLERAALSERFDPVPESISRSSCLFKHTFTYANTLLSIFRVTLQNRSQDTRATVVRGSTS